jgi:hypothetical protein
VPAGLCPAASLADIAAWLRYGATLLTFRTQLASMTVSSVTELAATMLRVGGGIILTARADPRP